MGKAFDAKHLTVLLVCDYIESRYTLSAKNFMSLRISTAAATKFEMKRNETDIFRIAT